MDELYEQEQEQQEIAEMLHEPKETNPITCCKSRCSSLPAAFPKKARTFYAEKRYARAN